jgi:hypothetical protein
MSREPFFYGHDWIGLYLANDLTEVANQFRFYADFLDGKSRLLREQMLLASPPTGDVCHWCDGRGIVELGDERATDCPACSASAIDAEGGVVGDESAVPKADAQ